MADFSDSSGSFVEKKILKRVGLGVTRVPSPNAAPFHVTIGLGLGPTLVCCTCTDARAGARG